MSDGVDDDVEVFVFGPTRGTDDEAGRAADDAEASEEREAEALALAPVHRLNRSDSELAHCLGLSVDAVKQTWRRIYERLAGCVPNLFPIDERLPSERRGAEKRRHVLDYMRLHLEEIRPWSPAKSMRDPR